MEIKKNDEFKIEITDLGSEGEGIGRFDGMPFFIKGAIPGDTVLAGVTKMKKTYGYARIVKLLNPSPDRVLPECSIAGRCGGCQLQHMSYAAQLKYKQDKVLNDLVRIGGIAKERFDVLSAEGSCSETVCKVDDDGKILFYPIIGMEEPWHYRNKGQFPVGMSKDGSIISGFYAGHTHSIIDTKSCMLQHPVTDLLMAAVKEYMSEAGVTAYDEEAAAAGSGVAGKGSGAGKSSSKDLGVVRHVLTRVGYTTGEVMVCVVINADKLPKEDLLAAKLKKAVLDYNDRMIRKTGDHSAEGGTDAVSGREGDEPDLRLASVSLNVNTRNTNVIMGERCRLLYGNLYITDFIGDVKYRISPLSFYQVNPVQTRRLYAAALEFAGLTGEETVWDLYCGIGTISLFLAQKAKKVYGVEIVPEAIDDAKENAVLNSIDNAEFFVGAAEEVLPAKYAEDPSMRADVIVVDPPRKGCDEALLECITKLEPKRIVYVSCDPATLARDVKYLEQHGYALKAVRPCDMFPHTSHVETVALLEQLKTAKEHIEITINAEDYYRIKDSQKKTEE
ncbi:MAG: 23S rRNA (uracil(1939)-C(5))-methyltransferase RlmD [Lachnospiraceae bacterium]|nr:23S rRNA (uracil(1939)-C(5))-methyltransferase RlmD [Lachnospiraceae bacterium]